MTIESFYDVYEDERVGEIVISDDASDLDIYEDLKSMCDALPKVRLFRNEANLDCYKNKRQSVSYANFDWVILLDSDNKIGKGYIDKLYQYNWVVPAIYTPDFAAPNFDFRQYSGLVVTRTNVVEYIDKPMFETCLNACNYFVNKNEYLKVWDGSIDPVTSDSIYFISKWLSEGNLLRIIEGLQYEHKVHEGSHYRTQNHRTPIGFHESVLNSIRNLK